MPSRWRVERWEERNFGIHSDVFCDDLGHWVRQDFRYVTGSDSLPPSDWIYFRVHQMKRGVVWDGLDWWREHEEFLRQEILVEEDDLWDNWVHFFLEDFGALMDSEYEQATGNSGPVPQWWVLEWMKSHLPTPVPFCLWSQSGYMEMGYNGKVRKFKSKVVTRWWGVITKQVQVQTC